MNISIIEKDACTGCHACVAVCPVSCIKMQPNDMGFPFPVADEQKCISCGKCIDSCEKTKVLPQLENQKIYAARNKSSSVIKNSASGGVFSALSDAVLNEKRGVVVGSAFTEGMQVRHIIAETFAERNRLRKSKYTYSFCDEKILFEVKSLLEKGRTVLFTGMPCQVSALNVYLNKDYKNLYCIDILCHGAESPKLYFEYIKRLSRNGEVADIDFRKPREGWRIFKTEVKYKSGKRVSGSSIQTYFNMFVKNLGLRHSCDTCVYASFNRVSDITLGDFWGIENTPISDFDCIDGVSVVIVNTQKGMKLFDKALEFLEVVESEKSHCVQDRLNGLKPVKKSYEFESEFLNSGYDFVAKKYAAKSLKLRISERLYENSFINHLRNSTKKLLKK